MKKRRFSLLLAALLTMAVLGGCGSDGTGESSGENSSTSTVVGGNTSEPEGEKTYGGTVVVGIQQDIDGLDPHKANSAGTKEILFNIFEGLVKPDENGNLIGAVASDYTISEDGLVYTFTLREGIKFHNGNLVTCEDVKYSLERVSGLLDGVPLMSTMKAVKSVDILDEKTVQVTIGEANPELLYSFTAAIIPAGSGEDENASPVGTGPFCFVSYTPLEGIVVKKNAEYWQEGLPYLDQVNFKIVASAETAMMELKGGSIDIYPYLTESQASELTEDFQMVSASSAVLQALFLNNAEKPLDDVRVRQAICYALDGDMINEFLYSGNSVLDATAMLPALKSFYVDLNSVYGTSANIEKAKELLAQAGYPDGFALEITIPSNYEVHMQTGEIVAEQLKSVGINATINPVEWQTWYDEVYKGRKYQATISGLAGDLTPGYIINRFQTDSAKNFVNFSNAEFDRVYQELQSIPDLKGREEPYKQLQKIVTEEAASAFIQVAPTNTAVSKKLAGYRCYPVYVQDMSTVYFVK
ncbi:MAG: ABC transporter substrate-binding protein [Acetatifactor sp.]